jgi:sodium/potassium/calcium exchanger 6
VRSPGTELSLESHTEEAPPNPPPSKRARVWLAFTRTMRVLFPTLMYFTKKSFAGMVAALFAAPAVLALTLTLPVVFTPQEDAKMPEKGTEARGRPLDGGAAEGQLIDYDDEGAEWTLVAEEIVGEEMHELRFNKCLMATQCILGPLFCAAVLLGDMKHFSLYAVVIGIAGAVTAVLVLVFADDGSDPAARAGRCSMGFFVAIVWIMAIADEVVQVLQVREKSWNQIKYSILTGPCRHSA